MEVITALDRLQAAGWVENSTRGLYRLVYNGECIVEQVIRCKEENR